MINFFRMYSTVIGNGRTLQQDMVLLGYKVPKGVRKNYIILRKPTTLILIIISQVQVVFPTLITGSMSEYVSQPDQFVPERWMKSEKGAGKIHPFASLPYGYGARMCLGRRFADLEIQVLLAKVSAKRLFSIIQFQKTTIRFMGQPTTGSIKKIVRARDQEGSRLNS